MSSTLSALGLTKEPSGASAPAVAGPSIEGMFQQILGAVQKSQLEIAELRQECADLRSTNMNLEKQVREGLQNVGVRGFSSGFATPNYAPSAPGSPLLRPKTPFLTPGAIPVLSVSAPNMNLAPSPLGENAIVGFPFSNAVGQGSGSTREIPGFFVIIPAGGAGTRLWPLSREGHPKFLLDLTLKGRSLIQSTWDRLVPLTTPARTTVVAGPAHINPIKEQLPEMLDQNLFCEPGPKDSMAAIGLAAAILGRRDPNAIIGSFAADHMISGDDAFLSAVTEAANVARQNFLVTIGIAPSHPSTGFGYIKLGDKLGLDDAPNARLVKEFKEKPDARTASAYIKTGNYRWNAGMFVTKATFLMELLKEYEPEIWRGLTKIADAWDTDNRQAVLDQIWPGLKKIPIDNAVAEPAAAQGRVAVVPATFGWDDVGDFSSLSDLIPAEASQPRILGDPNLVITESTAGGIIVPSSGRLIACLGVDDLVIVDMPDTLMVTTRARSQEVKRLVKRAKESGWKSLL